MHGCNGGDHPQATSHISLLKYRLPAVQLIRSKTVGGFKPTAFRPVRHISDSPQKTESSREARRKGLWCPREKLQGLTRICLYRQECLHQQRQSWLLISVVPVHLRRPAQMDAESVCFFTLGCQINVFFEKCLNPLPHIFGMYDAAFQTIAFPLCDCVVVLLSFLKCVCESQR